MASLYHHFRKIDKPEEEHKQQLGKKVIEETMVRTSRQKLPHISLNERNLYKDRINSCERSLYALKKYLNSDGYSSSLSNSVLHAEKSFTNMKDILNRNGYSLNDFTNGMYIESNLRKLSGILNSYENRLAKHPSEAMSRCAVVGGCTGGGVLVGVAVGASTGDFVGPIIGFGAVGLVVSVFANVFYNPSDKPQYKGKHKETIRNIIQYSDPFFDDLKNYLK